MKNNTNDISKNQASTVCCPVCGKVNRKSILANELCHCSRCETEFRIWVVHGFVTVFPIKVDEDEITSFNRFKEYHEQMMQLAQG